MNCTESAPSKNNMNTDHYQSESSSPQDATNHDDWQIQIQQPPPPTPLPFNVYPNIHHIRRPPNSNNYWSGGSAAINSSAIIWDFLMAQIRVQLRSMSPYECSSRSAELQMLARLDQHHYNHHMQPNVDAAVGQQQLLPSSISTGYQPYPSSYVATTISTSSLSISPMRRMSSTTMQVNQSNMYTPIQYQLGAGALGRQLLSSPLRSAGMKPLQDCSVTQHPCRSLQVEEVSSTPSKILDRYPVQQLQFNDGNKTLSSTTSCPSAANHPSSQLQGQRVPPTSLPFRLPTSNNQTTVKFQAHEHAFHTTQDDETPSTSKVNRPMTTENTASKLAEVPFNAKKKTKAKVKQPPTTTRRITSAVSSYTPQYQARKDTKKAAVKAKKVETKPPKKTHVKVKKTPVKVKKFVPKPQLLQRGKRNVVGSSTGSGIISPSDVDVLCGRGGLTNSHPGNMRFRDEARQMRGVYEKSTKENKTVLSEVSIMM